MKNKFRKMPIAAFLSGLTISRSKPENEVEIVELQGQLPSSLAAMFEYIHDEAIPVYPAFAGDPKNEQAKLVRVIGERMREARELCNMSQLEAARRLGYANSSKLAKIEGATDTNSVPLITVFRAAQVYDVSLDFLFGLSEDWEPDIRREASSFLMRTWEEARRRDLEIFDRLHRRVLVVMKAVEELGTGAGETSDALKVFIARNPDFEQMPAGARLFGAIERQASKAGEVDRSFRRFRSDLVGEKESKKNSDSVRV